MDSSPMRRVALTLVALGAAALTLIPAAVASAAVTARGTTSQGLPFQLVVGGANFEVAKIRTGIRLSCTSGDTYSRRVVLTSGEGKASVVARRGHHVIYRVNHNFSVSSTAPFVADDGSFLGIGTMQVLVIGTSRLDPGRTLSATGTLRATLTFPPNPPVDNGNTCTHDTPITYSATS